MPKNGENNLVAGIYSLEKPCPKGCKKPERITMPLNHKFPLCPTCKGSVVWKLDEPTKK